MKDNEWKQFKSGIVKYSILIAFLFELISLPFLGWNVRFAYGLALGTSIAIVNFFFLAFTSQSMLDRRGGFGLAMVGYLLRLFLYGGGFYISYKLGLTSGLATLLGFLTLKIAIYYVYGFKPGFSGSGVKGKKYNDLDHDGWDSEDKRHWFTAIRNIFKSQPDPEDQQDDPAAAQNRPLGENKSPAEEE